jgi:hypothetical protein
VGVFDALTGGAANTAYKNNMQTINTGLTQQSTALGDNYTSANNYLLGSGLPALTAGYSSGLQNLGVGYGNQRTDLAAGYGTGQGDLTQYGGQAQDAINAGYGAALGSLGQGRADLTSNYGQAADALTSNYGQARSDISGNYGNARSDLYDAAAQTQGLLGNITDSYARLVDQSAGAPTRYLNATGANGAAGSLQAQQDFVAAPGYQYALDQSLGSVQRSAAARGGLAGGNATSDILNTANGLASQGYQQYVNNLQNSAGLYTQGLQGQAQGLTAQANASQNYGSALSGIDTRQGDQLAGISTGLGNALASNYQGLGNALNSNDTAAAGLYTGQANALGNIYTGLGSSLNSSNIGLGTSLGGADANLGTGSSALNVGNGTGVYGAYNQVGSNLMNLGNQESAAIQNATKMYVDNENQKAKAQTEASGNLLGTLGGIINSPITGKIFGGLFS